MITRALEALEESPTSIPILVLLLRPPLSLDAALKVAACVAVDGVEDMEGVKFAVSLAEVADACNDAK